MDSFEESLQENVGFEGDEDPNTFEEFLEPEECIDLAHLFTTDRIFTSKDEFVDWAKQTAMNANIYLIITQYQRSRTLDHRLYVTLACEREGSVARLTEEELQQTGQFRKSHVPSRNILRFFQEQDVGCAVSTQKIYNVVAKIKRNRMQGRNTVEEVLYLSAERGYTIFPRNCEESNVHSDIVVEPPTSIAMIRTWPYVLIMDTTYKTNKVWTSQVLHFRVDNEPGRERTFCVEDVDINEISTGPISNVWEVRRLIKGVIYPMLPDDPCQPLSTPPEAAVTKGRRKTNSTKKDKSHWEYVSIAHRKIGKSIGSGSRSGSGSGSGSNPSSRGRGRPPRSGRGRGRGRSSGRSSLSSVVNLDSPSVSFPFNNAFRRFMYGFIQNWKNVVGDGNCEFRVVSNFLFGDENHWVEIRRRMSYDLQHRMNVYLQLFGSVERVTELIMKTNWEEGSAPPEYWMDTSDHLYVIANTFNLSVLQLVDGCPLPPLEVQWDYHRDIRAACLLMLDRVGENTLPKTELSQNPVRHVTLHAIKICNEPVSCGNPTITNILSPVLYPLNLISCHHIQSQANIQQIYSYSYNRSSKTYAYRACILRKNV
ncbi:hypothetical protein M9H77_17259 [Catharanthus roseus]|uniref:Uncharacterized protein n=1 Tax=Catharanthus roseus TaxID=4058 RepID=A0ACC0B440_CATRO|nr:hypothetical protein M9H77_17259 [Catharanthus roseus]